VLPGGQGSNSGTHGCSLTDCAGMSDSAPDLHMLNVVVGDMAASLDLYRRLGIAVAARLRPEATCSWECQVAWPTGRRGGKVAEQTL
jgi:hypothetical protein